MMYISLKKRLRTTITGIAQRYAAIHAEDTLENKLTEINLLIAKNIPRTRKDKDGLFVFIYNVAKEMRV